MTESTRHTEGERPRKGASRKVGIDLGGLAVVAIPILLFFALFGSVLFGGRQFAHRDVGYFYRPLFQEVHNAFRAGRIPLWDPYENLGQPLAANPAASVYYPGTAIFFLTDFTPLSFDGAFKVYVLFHVLLAFLSFFLLTRFRDAKGEALLSVSGGLWGAVAWTFGGSILFQVSNPIFLVGAAWLPLLFLFALRYWRGIWRNVDESGEKGEQRTGSMGNLVGMALVWSMMVTGGDPEIAYLGGVSLILLFLWLNWRKRRDSRAVEGAKTVPSRFSGIGGIFFAATLAIGLSAILILPAREMVRFSGRAKGSVPRSCWEIPATLWERSASGGGGANEGEDSFWDGILCREFRRGGHSWATYNFSVPPWRFTEFFWSNLGGEEFPVNARWFSSLPNEDRIWSPSLYMGLFPVLLAILGFAGTGRNEEGTTERDSFRRFLAGMAIFGLLASLGGFGLAWLLRVVTSGAKIADWGITDGDPVGGIYWTMNQVLPGFVNFRYPAKMMTLASLGIAFLAGFGWDSFWGRRDGMASSFDRSSSRPVPRWFLFFPLLLTGISLIGVLWIRWGDPFAHFEAWTGIDPFSSRTIFGPCDPERTRRIVLLSLTRTTILSLLFVGSIWLGKRRGRFAPTIRPWVRILFFGTLALDLFFAQRWMIGTVPESVFQKESPIAGVIRKDREGELPPARILRDPFLYPAPFVTSNSPNRLAERVLWDRWTLFQKDSMDKGIANGDVRGTFVIGDYDPVSQFHRLQWSRLKKRKGKEGDGEDRGDRVNSASGDWGYLLAVLGFDYLLGPDRLQPVLDRDDFIPVRLAGNGGEDSVGREGAMNQRDQGDGGNRRPRGVGLWRIGGAVGRVRVHHAKESPKDWRGLLHPSITSATLPGESAVIIRYEPEKIVTDVTLVEEGKVLWGEEFFPGWIATIYPLGGNGEGDSCPFEVPIVKSGSLLREISLPAGDYRVVMDYRPASFRWGAGISLLSWLGVVFFLLGGVFRSIFRHRR